MEQSDLLRYVSRAIESLGLRYFVTGSTATIFYGEPRFTNDIDVVVDLSELNIADFCRQFPQDQFYLIEPAVAQAVRQKSQFNIIHPTSGLKIDVIVPDASLFNRSRFERTRRVHAGDDFDVNFASPEDTIVKKMDFYREGGSEKHLRDITGVLKTSREEIDMNYITRWAEQMDLNSIWTMIQEKISKNPA